MPALWRHFLIVETYMALYHQYSAKEISMDVLKEMEASRVVRFENLGVSRQYNNLFVCRIICDPLEALINALCSQTFDSLDDVKALLQARQCPLDITVDKQLVCLSDDKGDVEIYATLLSDDKVKIERDDIDVTTTFTVYLKI